MVKVSHTDVKLFLSHFLVCVSHAGAEKMFRSLHVHLQCVVPSAWLQDSPKETPDKGEAKQAGDGQQVSGGVLDFSSGSDDEEEGRASDRRTVTSRAMDGGSGGTVASGPGRISLLQHGFSKLLETVKRKAEGGDGESSSDVGENSSGEESVDEQGKVASPTVCTKNTDGSGPFKVGTKTWEHSSSTDTEGPGSKEAGNRVKAPPPRQSHNAVRRMQQKRRNPGTSHLCLENYSDESDDLDVATRPKSNGVQSRFKVRDKHVGKSGSSRAGQDGGAAHKFRYSEEIEMFTSSEDEHTPMKKARPTRRHFTSPQNTVTPEKPTWTSSVVPTTGLKAPTSPGIRGTIDSVLGRSASTQVFMVLHWKVDCLPWMTTDCPCEGGVQEVMYTHSNQRVVGGSKAEELIGRAAMRDVFRRKVYSQLPANHILDSMEVDIALFHTHIYKYIY